MVNGCIHWYRMEAKYDAFIDGVGAGLTTKGKQVGTFRGVLFTIERTTYEGYLTSTVCYWYPVQSDKRLWLPPVGRLLISAFSNFYKTYSHQRISVYRHPRGQVSLIFYWKYYNCSVPNYLIHALITK